MEIDGNSVFLNATILKNPWKYHRKTHRNHGTDGNAPLEMLESPVLGKANKQSTDFE